MAVFAAMFVLNFVLSLEKTIFIPFYNLEAIAWAWCQLIICALASYYILKIRKFTYCDLIVGIILGIVVKYAGSYDYISAISTIICYYSACQIFRKYDQQNKYFYIGVKKLIKYLLLGALFAIPFSIINNLAIYFTNSNSFKSFSIYNISPSAFHALPAGISEEIIFHFFLLAFAVYVFKGNIPKNKATVFLVYFLCVVPHTLIHLPELFAIEPISALVSFLFMALLFGVPMVWLIRNKNLQTSIAFHWMVDFVRFLFTKV